MVLLVPVVLVGPAAAAVVAVARLASLISWRICPKRERTNNPLDYHTFYYKFTNNYDNHYCEVFRPTFFMVFMAV